MEGDTEGRARTYRRDGLGASASVAALRRHVEQVSARLEDEVRKLHQAEREPRSDAAEEVRRDKRNWQQDEAELVRSRRLIDRDLALLPSSTVAGSGAAGITGGAGCIRNVPEYQQTVRMVISRTE
jgi:hypothetical protein